MAQEKKKVGNRFSRWLREINSERKKVTWPSRKQIINNTWVALVVTTACAIAIFAFDFVAQEIVKTLIDFVG